MRASEVFGCDYTNLEQVIALADKMGRGMTVFKHPDHPNYNITHTSRTDQYEKAWIKYQTQE